jgi:hypothetical protein
MPFDDLPSLLPRELIDAVRRYMRRESGYTGGLDGRVPTEAELLRIVVELRRRALSLPAASSLDLWPLQEYADDQQSRRQDLPVSGYVPTQWRQEDLRSPRRQDLRYRADVALNDLEMAFDPARDSWEGADWDALQPVPRNLLRYMHGRGSAYLDDGLCQYVWHKAAVDVNANAVSIALSRANDFLNARQARRLLERLPDRQALHWV